MQINIEDLTIKQARELAAMFAPNTAAHCATSSYVSGASWIGKKVIIRGYAAGVHYGELIEKDGKEVILKNSRRLWYWKTDNKGISLSEVANGGLHKDSKVCSPIDLIWLEAAEIIPCTNIAIKNIEGQNEYKA